VAQVSTTTTPLFPRDPGLGLLSTKTDKNVAQLRGQRQRAGMTNSSVFGGQAGGGVVKLQHEDTLLAEHVENIL
jgi:hypothetical protein